MNYSFDAARLGDFCLKVGSGATPKGGKEVYLESGEFSLIRSQNVLNNQFSTNGLAFITIEAAEKLNGVSVESGDVLLNITGDSVARCCSAPPHVLPARVNQHVAIIRPDPAEFHPLFVRYFLVSPVQQDHMLQLASSGATRNALTKGMIEDFLIPKPDIDTQRGIAKVLADLDDKIDLLREINRTLEEIIRAVFRAWFIDFEPVRAKAAGAPSFCGMPQDLFDTLPDSFEQSEKGEIPTGWTTAPLSELVAQPIKRGLAPKYVSENGVAVLNQKCVRNWQVNFDLARRHDEIAKPLKDKTVELLDILVNSTGVGTLGRVAQVHELRETTTVDSHLSLVRPNTERIAPIMLGIDLMERETEIERLGHGSTGQTELSRDKLGVMPITVPAENMQRAFDEMVMPLIEHKTTNCNEIVTLAALRDTLLPKFISGELQAPSLEAIGLEGGE